MPVFNLRSKMILTDFIPRQKTPDVIVRNDQVAVGSAKAQNLTPAPIQLNTLYYSTPRIYFDQTVASVLNNQQWYKALYEGYYTFNITYANSIASATSPWDGGSTFAVDGKAVSTTFRNVYSMGLYVSFSLHMNVGQILHSTGTIFSFLSAGV